MLQKYLNALTPWPLYFFDVTVALVVFVGGNALLSLTGCGSWATALGMIPFGWWLWYRGAMPNAALYPALGIIGLFTMIDLAQEVWWPNQAENFAWIKILLAYVGVMFMRRRNVSIEQHSNPIPLSHA